MTFFIYFCLLLGSWISNKPKKYIVIFNSSNKQNFGNNKGPKKNLWEIIKNQLKKIFSLKFILNCIFIGVIGYILRYFIEYSLMYSICFTGFSLTINGIIEKLFENNIFPMGPNSKDEKLLGFFSEKNPTSNSDFSTSGSSSLVGPSESNDITGPSESNDIIEPSVSNTTEGPSIDNAIESSNRIKYKGGHESWDPEVNKAWSRFNLPTAEDLFGIPAVPFDPKLDPPKCFEPFDGPKISYLGATNSWMRSAPYNWLSNLPDNVNIDIIQQNCEHYTREKETAQAIKNEMVRRGISISNTEEYFAIEKKIEGLEKQIKSWEWVKASFDSRNK